MSHFHREDMVLNEDGKSFKWPFIVNTYKPWHRRTCYKGQWISFDRKYWKVYMLEGGVKCQD